MNETQQTWVQSLGWEDPLEEGIATHSSVLTWRIPWTEEPGRLQSIGSHSQTELKWLSERAWTAPFPPVSHASGCLLILPFCPLQFWQISDFSLLSLCYAGRQRSHSAPSARNRESLQTCPGPHSPRFLLKGVSPAKRHRLGCGQAPPTATHLCSAALLPF